MRLITLVWWAYLCFSVHALENEISYDSEDTVVLEAALDDEVEAEATTLADEEVTTSFPVEVESDRQIRQEPFDGTPTCMTKNGLIGACESVQDCYPRLFPAHSSSDDTPNRSGVYNQNLLRILIETSGFCGPSGPSARDNLAHVKKLHICCPTVKVEKDYPLDINNATVDEEYSKKSCGKIKIDSKLLPPSDEKIVGGREAVLGEYPWMVAMLRRGSQFCGASLIDNKNVLTAAHCVEFMTKNDVAALRLHIGDLNIYSTKDTQHLERKAKRVLYHKGFTMKNLAHDLALIHLDKPVTFSDTVQPICLHPGDPPYDTGKSDADVAGWGTTSSGGTQSSKLLGVRIRVITNNECNEKYAEKNKMVGAGMVCAGSKKKDSCQGDSGGPLVVDARGQAKQIGIVSWGIGCATYPGVYTRVDKYMKWINKNRQ